MANSFDFRKTGDIVYTKQRGDTPPEEWWIYLPTIGELEQIETAGAQLREQILTLSEQFAPLREATEAYTAARDADAPAKKVEELAKAVERATAEAPFTIDEFNQKLTDYRLEWLQTVINLVGSGWPSDRKDWPMQTRKPEFGPTVREHWSNAPLSVSDSA